MPDMEDDWMNPSAQTISLSQAPVDELPDVEYLIERCQRQICFGTPGYIDEWKYWSRHDSPEERDAELKRLNEEHPMWHLRARDRKPKLERMGIYPPISRPGINP